MRPALWYNAEYFYPRSPCGERLLRRSASCNCQNISIHALLAESDTKSAEFICRYFQISIHALLAESDVNQKRPGLRKRISIHALLAESDRAQNGP